MTSVVAPVDANVRSVVKMLMAYRNEIQHDLAAATGIPQTTLQRRLRGSGTGREWRAFEVAALAAHYEVPVAALYDGPQSVLEAMQGGSRRPYFPTASGAVAA